MLQHGFGKHMAGTIQEFHIYHSLEFQQQLIY